MLLSAGFPGPVAAVGVRRAVVDGVSAAAEAVPPG